MITFAIEKELYASCTFLFVFEQRPFELDREYDGGDFAAPVIEWNH